MTDNAAGVVDIEGSPSRLLGLAALGIFMSGGSAVVGFDLIPDMGGADPITRAICVFGTFFFALCTLIALWRLLFGRGPVVSMSQQGICDRRVAADVIPWSAIRRISTWQYAGQRVLVLNVDPAVERTLRLSMIAKYSRSANRALGADGLCVTAQGLKISYDELFELVKARVPAGRAG